MEEDWSKLASYGSGFEADIVRSMLEEAEILVQIRGLPTGIFGPSYQGPVMGGIELFVPTTDLERAMEIIGTTE